MVEGHWRCQLKKLTGTEIKARKSVVDVENEIVEYAIEGYIIALQANLWSFYQKANRKNALVAIPGQPFTQVRYSDKKSDKNGYG